MVFQRGQINPVWGKAAPGEQIVIRIADQEHRTLAGENGRWKIKLKPMPAGGPHVLEIAGDNTLRFTDVLIGEVWLCSGQSNMEWPLSKSDAYDLELATANNSQIRLLKVAKKGSQLPLDDFQGTWKVCSSNSVKDFSAVGYHFGRRLQDALGVPIGLISNSWGASAAEAWVPRNILDRYERYSTYLEEYDALVEGHSDAIQKQNEARFKVWNEGGRVGKRPPAPIDPRYGQKRPANLYNGVLHPIIGFGIRGVIWYQGESNVGRAADYNHLFSLLIQTWRDKWGQGDFPFYWAQLADFHGEREEPADSGWARLREAQTATLSLSNTGEAVIIDSGEGNDIHPRDKRVVADRLARHALSKVHGFTVSPDSPCFASMEIAESVATITFDSVSPQGLYTFDVRTLRGFAIAGEDRKFKWAKAEIKGPSVVEVSHPDIPNPVAVRYGWADNPVVNLFDRNGLPVTPFRTDQW
ncbi:MAG: sialate O-acetylesterase [Coraliomargaritaceae bacterium]